MKEEEKIYYCKSFFECKERCSGYTRERWEPFDCGYYENTDIHHAKKIVLRSEPVTYFENLMRKKIRSVNEKK